MEAQGNKFYATGRCQKKGTKKNDIKHTRQRDCNTRGLATAGIRSRIAKEVSKLCHICGYPIENGHKVKATPIGMAHGWCADVRHLESVAYAAEVNAKAFAAMARRRETEWVRSALRQIFAALWAN